MVFVGAKACLAHYDVREYAHCDHFLCFTTIDSPYEETAEMQEIKKPHRMVRLFLFTL